MLHDHDWRAFGKAAGVMTCSITELLATGVVLEADEAVAIAQQLIAALRDVHETDEVQPPFGPPSADNVFLREDGTVFCRGCRTTPAVSEIGIFLDSLLPEGSPRVPGGLRYTIARALLNIDVPPFGSLDELSRDMARHELGDRAAAVQRALARYGAVSTTALVSHVDRRRHHASVIDLRRALKEAYARLVEQERNASEPLIDMQPPLDHARRDHARLTAAACLAAGLALVSASELMHRRQAPDVSTQSAPAVIPAIAPGEPQTGAKPAAASPAHGIIAVHDTPASRAHATQPEPPRISVKRVGRSQAGAVGRQGASRPSEGAQRRQPSRGVLDRLRLGWLRSVL
jgi:hypothetical protein